MNTSRNPVLIVGVFLALTAILYAAGVWLIFRLSSATPLMLTVGLAAILTCLLTRIELRALGWHWVSWRYHWFSYLLPLGYIAFAYSFIWIVGIGGWYNTAFVLELQEEYNLGAWSNTAVITFQFLLTATVSFFLLLPGVLGEELGWRGLLVPQLAKVMPFTGVAIVSGVLWAVWHWPLMFMGLYGNENSPFIYQLACFTLCIVSMSVVMTYIRLKSQSLWPAVVFHMSHNVFLQKFFNPLTDERTNSSWFLDEFGAVVPVLILLIAIYYWRKGRYEFSPAKT